VRAERFLLLEAGHLMQNLCLVSTSLGLVTIPLGGFLEDEIAMELCLLAGDRVLSCGVCGGLP
jgi:nitroreductase